MQHSSAQLERSDMSTVEHVEETQLVFIMHCAVFVWANRSLSQAWATVCMIRILPALRGLCKSFARSWGPLKACTFYILAPSNRHKARMAGSTSTTGWWLQLQHGYYWTHQETKCIAQKQKSSITVGLVQSTAIIL